MSNNMHFSHETSREDLKNFIDSLPMDEFKYSGLIKAYSEYVTHEIYTDKYVMQLPKRYFSKTSNKKRSKNKDQPVKDRTRKSKWTEEETKALFNGIKKFGFGKWNEIYNDNKEIFYNKNITPTDLRIKYTRFRDLPEWRQFDPEFNK